VTGTAFWFWNTAWTAGSIADFTCTALPSLSSQITRPEASEGRDFKEALRVSGTARRLGR